MWAPAEDQETQRGQGIGQWRLEVWPYRVRYDVEGATVILYRVRHRKDIYLESQKERLGARLAKEVRVLAETR